MLKVPFSTLASADLRVDAVYEGGRRGNAGDDPLPLLLGVSNQGGFRYRGTLDRPELVVLTSTMCDPDWPDSLDPETGVFTYFGDNKKPGRTLHETRRFGNELLRRMFEGVHGGEEGRLSIPPVFIFANAGEWRDVVFLGLAVPGSADLRPSEDLVAIWKTSDGRRFQNYRARFTVLNVPEVPRTWITDLLSQNPLSSTNAPTTWTTWKRTGRIVPLQANRSVEYRTKAEQLPQESTGEAVIQKLVSYFEDHPSEFEHCAAAIAMLMLPDITSMDVTRPTRDGGRDAVGKMRIGLGAASILVDFALEAKCYNLRQGVGVREMSRLISRLRHRQFGILVTTSYLDVYAYKEIKEDQHPIIVIAASDIVDLLRKNGYADPSIVGDWLAREFPRETATDSRPAGIRRSSRIPSPLTGSDKE